MKENHYIYQELKRKYLVFAIAVLSFMILIGKCIAVNAAEETLKSFRIGNIKYKILPDDSDSSSPSVSVYCTTKFRHKTGNYIIPSTVTYKGITYTITQIGSEEIMAGYHQLYPFTNNFFSSITIPGTVKTITGNSFEYSHKITEIVIPSGVETIKDGSFYGCGNLKKLVLSDTVKNISEDAFTYCDKLDEIIVDEDNPYIMVKDGAILSKDGKKLIYGPKTVKSYTIPEGVTEICPGAFVWSKITKIVIPENVKLGERAFQHSFKLTKVTIRKGITEIPASTFGYNSFLREVVIPDSVTKIGDNAFEGQLSVRGSIDVLELPSGLQYIGTGAFPQLNITRLNLPEGLTYLGERAFMRCEALKELTIPSSLKIINSRAFFGCSNLTSVKIQEGVKEIHGFSFLNCPSLKSFNIPASVDVIQEGALSWCNDINLTVAAENPHYKSVNNALLTKDGKTILFCPITKTTYTIPAGVSVVGQDAILSEKLKRLVIGKSVKQICIEIGDCGNLKSIEFKGTTPPPGLKFNFDMSGFTDGVIEIQKVTITVPKGSLSKYKKVINHKAITLKEAR